MSLYWVRMSPRPNDYVFLGRGEDTHREKGHVGMEADTGVLQLQARERPGLPGALRSQEVMRRHLP